MSRKRRNIEYVYEIILAKNPIALAHYQNYKLHPFWYTHLNWIDEGRHSTKDNIYILIKRRGNEKKEEDSTQLSDDV